MEGNGGSLISLISMTDDAPGGADPVSDRQVGSGVNGLARAVDDP